MPQPEEAAEPRGTVIIALEFNLLRERLNMGRRLVPGLSLPSGSGFFHLNDSKLSCFGNPASPGRIQLMTQLFSPSFGRDSRPAARLALPQEPGMLRLTGLLFLAYNPSGWRAVAAPASTALRPCRVQAKYS